MWLDTHTHTLAAVVAKGTGRCVVGRTHTHTLAAVVANLLYIYIGMCAGLVPKILDWDIESGNESQQIISCPSLGNGVFFKSLDYRQWGYR